MQTPWPQALGAGRSRHLMAPQQLRDDWGPQQAGSASPGPHPSAPPPGDISLYLVGEVAQRVESSGGQLGGALAWPPFLHGL